MPILSSGIDISVYSTVKWRELGVTEVLGQYLFVTLRLVYSVCYHTDFAFVFSIEDIAAHDHIAANVHYSGQKCLKDFS